MDKKILIKEDIFGLQKEYFVLVTLMHEKSVCVCVYVYTFVPEGRCVLIFDRKR